MRYVYPAFSEVILARTPAEEGQSASPVTPLVSQTTASATIRQRWPAACSSRPIFFKGIEPRQLTS